MPESDFASMGRSSEPREWVIFRPVPRLATGATPDPAAKGHVLDYLLEPGRRQPAQVALAAGERHRRR
jgi:hypothetical protein